jgi:UDP-N-acetylglucosamine transferase subunit ALG13
LIKEIDRLKGEGKINADVFAQTGNCTYAPKNFQHKKFLGDSEYEKMVENADVIISHAGAGSIINALRNRKPLIIVPRLVEYGEHTNSHQVDLAKAMHERKKAIACMEISKLEQCLKDAWSFRPNIDSDRQKLVVALNKYMGELK